MNGMNILITAASRRVPLVQAFRQCARLARRAWPRRGDGRQPAVAGRSRRRPGVSSPARARLRVPARAAEDLRGRAAFGLAVPTIDDEVELFGAARQTFADLGALAACSSQETAALCNDKYATWRMLADAGVPAARTYLPEQLAGAATSSRSSSSRASAVGRWVRYMIRNQRELDFFLTYVDQPVIQEYLDSPEYTIDVLCDSRGRPVSIVPRERVVIRAGVIDRGRTVKWPALIELAEQACARDPFCRRDQHPVPAS